jgi:Holliday junction DNA helicase RuvA
MDAKIIQSAILLLGNYQLKMIGKIKGKLIEKIDNLGLIETNGGVSFWIKLGLKTLNKLAINEPIEIYTYLQVSEDNLSLFGFDNLSQYRLFQLLLQVNGVGPKTAHNIVTYADSEEILTAVKENNIEYFIQIPGTGKKTSARIILELSSHLKKEANIPNLTFSDDDRLLIDTLKNLGFSSSQIHHVFNKIPKNIPFEERLKIALKKIKNEK